MLIKKQTSKQKTSSIRNPNKTHWLTKIKQSNECREESSWEAEGDMGGWEGARERSAGGSGKYDPSACIKLSE